MSGTAHQGGGRYMYPKPEPAPGSTAVREYRACAVCGRRFPVYVLSGRPPRRCYRDRQKRGPLGVFTG